MYAQFKIDYYDSVLDLEFKKDEICKVIKEDQEYVYIQNPLSPYSKDLCFLKGNGIMKEFNKKQSKLHKILCKLGIHKYCIPFMDGIHKHGKWSLMEERRECIYCNKREWR